MLETVSTADDEILDFGELLVDRAERGSCLCAKASQLCLDCPEPRLYCCQLCLQPPQDRAHAPAGSRPMHSPRPEQHGNQPGTLQAPLCALPGLPAWPSHHRIGRADIWAAPIHSLTPAKCRRQAPDDPRPATAAPSTASTRRVGSSVRMWSSCWLGSSAGNVGASPSGRMRVQRRGVGGVMLRSPINTLRAGKAAQVADQPPQLRPVPAGHERQVGIGDGQRPERGVDPARPSPPAAPHGRPGRDAARADTSGTAPESVASRTTCQLSTRETATASAMP